MGKQTGLIKVSGNIGGVSFYKSNGQNLARVSNGPSKEKIQNDGNFVRTRENNSEFGGAATSAKSLRMALASSIQSMGDNRLTSRLTALFKDILSKSNGIRGQRSIELSLYKASLEGLELNNKLAFGSMFNAPFSLSLDVPRVSPAINILPFSAQTFVNAPPGATHFQLIAALGVVSDFVFNVNSGKYEPSNPTLDRLSDVKFGGVTPIGGPSQVSFGLTPTVPGLPAMTADVSVVVCLGIEFFQQVNGTDYNLAQGNCMKVLKVY
jgi:hypothetical protein